MDHMNQFTATYSLEDNKLRLYATERLEPDLYARVKSAGYIWAPRQELFVAPMWTPQREALAIELAGSIENEESTLEQRATDRAERFSGYSEKRAADAETYTDAADKMSESFPGGSPILIGHHSERKARKLQERMHNTMKKAVAFYDQSEYWADRTAGVLSNVKYKQLPRVRINRIKGLESDARKQAKHLAEYDKNLQTVVSGLTLESATRFFEYVHYKLRLSPEDRELYGIGLLYEGHDSTFSCYDLLKKNYPLEVVVRRLAAGIEVSKQHHAKWLAHYEMRIRYEREMLVAGGHEMPDFKAISAANRKETTSKPIVNTPDLENVVTFTKAEIAKKKQHYFEHYVRPSKCGTYRVRMVNGRHCGRTTGNDSWTGFILYIKDQKRVDVPGAV